MNEKVRKGQSHDTSMPGYKPRLGTIGRQPSDAM